MTDMKQVLGWENTMEDGLEGSGDASQHSSSCTSEG